MSDPVQGDLVVFKTTDGAVTIESISQERQSEITRQAKEQVDKLVAFITNNQHNQTQLRATVMNLGASASDKVLTQSKMLQTSLSSLYGKDGEGTGIEPILNKLQGSVTKVDPRRVSFSGWHPLNMFAAVVTFAGPIKRYMRNFQKAQTFINKMITELDAQRVILENDITTVSSERDALNQAVIPFLINHSELFKYPAVAG